EGDRLSGAERERRLERGGDRGAGRLVARGPRHDDVLPSGERLAEGFPRLAPHDDRVAEREVLEVAKVLREVPGKSALHADHAVRGDGGQEIDAGVFRVYAVGQA